MSWNTSFFHFSHTTALVKSVRLLATSLFVLLFSARLFAASSDMPDWLLSPPSDSDTWFYSVGSGIDVNEARFDALAQLASRIQINVQSNTQQFIEQNNQQVDYYLELDNRFSSDSFDFNNVDIVREFNDANSIYLLVKIDRQSFFDAQAKQLSDTLNTIQLNDDDSTALRVEKLLTYRWQKNKIDNTFTLLKAYQQDINVLEFLQKQIELENAQTANSIKLSLNLKPDNNDPNNSIRNALLDWLQQAGIKSAIRVDAGFSRSANQPLEVVMTTPTYRFGQDDFHHVTHISTELTFIFQQNLLLQKQISATGFANSTSSATKQAIADIVRQIENN